MAGVDETRGRGGRRRLRVFHEMKSYQIDSVRSSAWPEEISL